MRDQGSFRFLLYKQGGSEISEVKDIGFLVRSCINSGISEERAQRLAKEAEGKAFTRESLDKALIDLGFSLEERENIINIFFYGEIYKM